MPYPNCFTSSSIGPAPTLHKNFLDRPETVSIYWDDAMIVASDNPFLRVIHHCEPPEVFPTIADQIIANKNYYDLIMTYDPRVLAACDNAVFLTESACSWIDRKSGGTPAPFIHNFPDGPAPLSPTVPNYQSCDVSKKEYAVSFLPSSKNQFPGHRLRQRVYEALPEQVNGLRVWKHRSPPRIDDKRPTLEPYQFSIVLENSRHEGYFSEKLIDCFVAKTIPIYWGCPDIHRHFNPEGLLYFTDEVGLDIVLNNLTPKVYENLLPAIEENFLRALQTVHQWDIIEHYINEAIYNKHAKGNHRSEMVIMRVFNPEPQAIVQQARRLYRPGKGQQ